MNAIKYYKLFSRIFNIFILFVFINNKLYAQVSLQELAEASSEVYRDQPRDLLNYEFREKLEVCGFKVAVYQHKKLEDRIIVFRGSQNKDNWIFNSTHVGCATCGDGGVDANNRFDNAILNLHDFFKLHANENTLVTGHSLGGFLAQYFSKFYSVGGASFNAPGLGNFDLRSKNSQKLLFERYVDLLSKLSSFLLNKVFSHLVDACDEFDDLVTFPVKLSILPCRICEGLFNFKNKIFINHRLEGDPVSNLSGKHLNACEDFDLEPQEVTKKGFYGKVITHKHSFWNQVYTHLDPARLHSMNLFLEHLQGASCSQSGDCQGEDNRSGLRQSLGHLIGIR